MTHITNGDIFTERLRSLGLEGNVITWRENHLLGRGSAGRGSGGRGSGGRGSFLELRADALAQTTGGDRIDILNSLTEQDDALRSIANEEIVVWLEPDLFDYLLVAQILSIISESKNASTNKVYLAFAKKNLMSLSSDQLSSLFISRELVSTGLFEANTEFWRVFTSGNQTALEVWCNANLQSPIELISKTAQAISRFMLVDETTGLTGIEMVVKEALNGTPVEQANVGEILGAVQQQLGNENFLTDVQLVSILRRLRS